MRFFRCLLLIGAFAVVACSGDDPVEQTDGQVGPDAAVPMDGATVDSGSSGEDAGSLPDASLDAGPDAAPDASPSLRDDGLSPPTWYEQVTAAADREHLAAELTAAAYVPPAGAYVMAARVVDGVGQPAFRFYSLADTGFEYSVGDFWPASTVKLAAAVGALQTLGTHGLTGAAQVSFQDDDGSYSGTVANLYDLAISVSSNVAYNRLVEIAGFDELNDQLLVDANGLSEMVIQRRYTHPFPSSNLRTSPELTYVEGGLSGTIPQRVGTGQHPQCPNEGNCLTLCELLEVMRRVTLHAEVPSSHRFPISAADLGGLHQALLDSASRITDGALVALAHPVTVYNKTGTVPGDDRLDHGLVVDTVTGDRYLVALSLPEPTTTNADLTRLAEEVLLVLLADASQAPPLQLDAGVQITVQVDGLGGQTYRLQVDAPGADEVRLWADRWSLPTVDPPAVNQTPFHRLDHTFSQVGQRQLVVQALQSGQPMGYRVLHVLLP